MNKYDELKEDFIESHCKHCDEFDRCKDIDGSLLDQHVEDCFRIWIADKGEPEDDM